jgi:hypothetical protein
MDKISKPNIVFFMMDQLSAKWLEAARGASCLRWEYIYDMSNKADVRRLLATARGSAEGAT